MKVFRPMDWQQLKHEYQLDGKRLLPWIGWNTPFGGAWCVVRANTESLLHDHEEQEMFVVASGQATICIGEERYLASKGDFIAISPGNNHYVINDHDEDFHFFTIWWDQESCHTFLRTLDSHQESMNG